MCSNAFLMGLRDVIQSATHHRGPSIWRKLLGWLCVVIGLPGLILPILPGIPLLVLGIVLLSREYHWAHRLLVWVKSRFPAIHSIHPHEHEPQSAAEDDREKPREEAEKS